MSKGNYGIQTLKRKLVMKKLMLLNSWNHTILIIWRFNHARRDARAERY